MSGFGKLAAYGATTAYIGSVGLPLAPLGWAIAVAFEIGGGVLWFLVFVRGRSRRSSRVRLGDGDLLVTETSVDQNQMIHFLKNIMIHRRAFATRAFWRRTLQSGRTESARSQNVAGATA